MEAANFVPKSVVSKCVIGLTPLRPASRPFQVSSKLGPSEVMLPSPVTTTRRAFMLTVVLRPDPSGGAHVRLDEVHGVAHGLDLLGLLVGDRDVEVILELHHQLDRVER